VESHPISAARSRAARPPSRPRRPRCLISTVEELWDRAPCPRPRRLRMARHSFAWTDRSAWRALWSDQCRALGGL